MSNMPYDKIVIAQITAALKARGFTDKNIARLVRIWYIESGLKPPAKGR